MGEALAAGSEPGEAAKPSSAKRVGVSPRQQPGRGPATGLDMADVPVTLPRHPTSLRAARGHQWGGSGETGGCCHSGGPHAEPHKAGQDMLRLKTGTGTAGSSWSKGDNTEGHTAPSRPTTPPAMVLQPWLDPCLPPAPKHHPGGQRGHPVSPHPQHTPRGLWGRSGSSAGLTWRLLVSPWSQALLVCFCFSAEGRQGVNPSGGAGGAASQRSGCQLRQRCPNTPATAASPGTGLWSVPSHRPRSPASQEPGPPSCTLRPVPRPPRGWGHLPWCCRDFSPCWAWLCSSSRCGGRVLGKKTLSGHSSPAVYCTLSRFSASPLAAPAEIEGSAWLGGHSRAPTDAPPPTGCSPSKPGEAPGNDSQPGMTLSRSSPNRALEAPGEKLSPVALPGRSIHQSQAVSTVKLQGFLPTGQSRAGTQHHPPPQHLR